MRTMHLAGWLSVALLATSATAAGAAICTANVAATPVQCPAVPSAGHPTSRRDAYGVPHITAQNFYDLNYQIGIEDARDRLVQLEFFRRASKGTLAEVFGRTEIQADMDARLTLYTEEERQYFFSTLPCQTQLALQAYADGINYYIDRIYKGRMRQVPHEFYNIGELLLLSTPFGLPAGVTYQLLDVDNEALFKPGPWTVTDSVAIAEMLVAQFGGGGGRELRQLALRNYLTTWLTRRGESHPAEAAMQIFDDVRWINDPKAPTSVPPNGAVRRVNTPDGTMAFPEPPRCRLGAQGAGAAASLTPAAAVDSLPQGVVLQALADINRLHDSVAERARRFGVPSLHGSNAWVVAPNRSANGHALLWGGPQEGFGVPNIDNEIYARSPDLAVGGMKIPGAPAILIGMTDRFAFTTTSGEMDNSTLYVETLDPTRAPTDPQTADSQYFFRFNGEYHQMDRRVETIHFAGEDPTKPPAYSLPAHPPVRAAVLYNVFRVNDCDPQHFHGPVLSFDFSDPAQPRAFSNKTAYWKNETSTLQGFAAMNTAKTFSDFDNAVAQVVSLHNFLYADYLGNIAYWTTGSKVNYPPDYDNRFPADGTGSQEWRPNTDGTMYTPFSRLIYSVNPDQGYLVNWNTKPTDEPCVLEGNSHDEHWGEIYRSTRIAALLDHSQQVSLDDMQRIAKDIGTIDNSEDTVAPSAAFFVPVITQAYANLVMQASPLVDPSQHPLLADAVYTLNQWNNTLSDTAQIFTADQHYRADYSPFLGQPGLSVLFQWWYALKTNLFGGGMSADEPFVGTIDFSDHSIDGNDYLGETTINMVVHALEGSAAGVPQEYAGDYFGGHRDEIIIESLLDAIALLQGTAPLPQLSYGTCDGGQAHTPGFGTGDISSWGWQSPSNLDFDCIGSLTSTMFAAGTAPTHFGSVPTYNRSTYMQVLSAGLPPQGANVVAPGQSAFIRHYPGGRGKVSGHFGDQVELFRNFEYKPMVLP